jgi:hypothetical protein
MRAKFRTPTLDGPLARALPSGEPVHPLRAGEQHDPGIEHSWAALYHLEGGKYVIEPVAESILVWLLAQAEQPGSPIAFVAAPYFAPTVDKWARAEARRIRYEAELQEQGEFDDEGKPRPMMEMLSVWDKRAAYYAASLGLDPPSLAKIRYHLAEAHREEDSVVVMRELQGKYAARSIGMPRVGRGNEDGEMVIRGVVGE